MVKALDLFAGLEGWSQSFKDRGHDIFSVDYSTDFNVSLHKDIRDLKVDDLPWKPDIILASPPCEKFSVLTVGRNWNLDNTPKNEKVQEAVDIVLAALKFIEDVNPKYWIMENPRGKLRKLDFMAPYHRETVTYCQYGLNFMKPTDLWGVFPESLTLRNMCKNGSPCHERAPRGSRNSTQGTDATVIKKFTGGMIADMVKLSSDSPKRKLLTALRSKIPYELSLDVCIAVEKDLGEY